MLFLKIILVLLIIWLKKKVNLKIKSYGFIGGTTQNFAIRHDKIMIAELRITMELIFEKALMMRVVLIGQLEMVISELWSLF